MKNNNLIAIIALAAVIAGGSYLVWKRSQPQIQVFDGQEAVRQMEANDRTVGIEEYMKRNISGISAEAGYPEELGGTFYITQFEAHGGAGTVSYEDGHNAYTADFAYATDKKGLVSVTSFTVRK
jgi:hypothetical protein